MSRDPEGACAPQEAANRSFRQRAEELLAARPMAPLNTGDAQELVHELQVHELELELQNQALREAQMQLEAARDQQARVAARYRDLYQTAPAGYLDVASTGTILEVNRTAASLLASEESCLTGRKLSDYVVPADQDLWFLKRRQLAAGTVAEAVFLLRVSPGEAPERTLEVRARARGPCGPGAASHGPQLRLALLDVTEREEAQRAREAAEMRELGAYERERRNLAEKLHDDVGQILSLVSMRLAALSEEAGSAAQCARVAEISGLLEEVRGKVASLSAQLSPGLLYDLGLAAAAEWLAEEMQRVYALTVEISADPPDLDEGIDDVTRALLFRALRELVVNVARHAGAPVAQVRMRRSSDLTLEVSDEGQGFDASNAAYGLGLSSVHRRITQLGGRFEIETRPGRGTRVSITFPVPEARTPRPAGTAWTGMDR